MDWPEIVELKLDGIAQGGEGVGRWNNRVVFAGGGLPDEHVKVRLTERKEAFARGEVVELLSTAPERIAPRDVQADHMPWQHIEYAAQLRFKQQILTEQLRKIGGLADVAVSETVPAAREWGYRNTGRFHVQNGLVGYHVAGTRTLRPLNSDPLLLPSLNDALKAFTLLLTEADDVSEVTLRTSETNGFTVGVLRGQGDLRTLARRWMARAPGIAGVSLPEGQQGDVDLSEELGGVTFLLQPEGFFQVNLAAAETLLGLVEAALTLNKQERLLDLYCGVGTFALPLARHVAEVTGMEEYAGAVRDAERSAKANNIVNATFRTGAVERVLATFDQPTDALVMDPPRRGCHPRALDEVIRLAPQRIAYVSCHPGTLARDLKALVAGGYTVRHVTPVDLFPQTPHIESVSLLERGA